jgi:DNA-binding PadR family transcriptional regulator
MAGDNVQMFILGSLTQGEAHGYQLAARAKQWGVDRWAGFSAGSIYNALRTLDKNGLIEQRGTEQHGSYAPATIYGITEAGRTRAVEMLRRTAAETVTHDPFDLVTAFLGLFSVEERKELIEAHIANLERRRQLWDEQYRHMREHVDRGEPYDWVLAAMEKSRRAAELLISCAEELLTRCEGWAAPAPLRSSDLDAGQNEPQRPRPGAGQNDSAPSAPAATDPADDENGGTNVRR